MALTFYSRLQQLTLDGTHEYSAGASTWVSEGSTSFSSAAGFVGDGLLVATSSSYLRMNPTSIASGATGSAGFMIRFPSSASTFGSRLAFFTVSGSERIDVNINSNSFRLQYVSSATYSVQANVSIAANTWYGVVIRWDQPNSLLRLEMYDASGNALGSWEYGGAFNVISAALGGEFGMRIGTNASSTETAHYDNLFVASNADELIELNLGINSYTAYDSSPPSPPVEFGITAATAYQHGALCTLTVAGADDAYAVWWGPSSVAHDVTGAVELTVDSDDLDGNGDGTIVVEAERGFVLYNQEGYLWLVQGSDEASFPVILLPHGGRQMTVLSSLVADNRRVWAIPDLEPGNVLIGYGATPSGSFEILPDGSVVAEEVVDGFYAEAWVEGFGYTNAEFQALAGTLSVDVSPDGVSATGSAGNVFVGFDGQPVITDVPNMIRGRRAVILVSNL